MPPMRLDEAEQIRNVIVDPLVDALRAEILPIKTLVDQHEKRLKEIESNQHKALLGFAGVALALTLAFNAMWVWVKRKAGWE